MKVTVFVFGLLISLSALAQTGLPPIYDIHKDTAYYAIDTAHFQLLDDAAGTLTLDQVSRPPLSGRFYHDAFSNRKRTAGVYWLRLRIRNNLPTPAQLLYTDSGSDYADFYTQTGPARWQHQRGGNLRPYSERTLHGGIRVQTRFAVALLPGETKVVYLRSEVVFWHSRRTYIAPNLITEQSRMDSSFRYFLTDGWQDYLFSGIMMGILLLAAICNVLIFISI